MLKLLSLFLGLVACRSVTCYGFSSWTMSTAVATKHTFFDIPVSNNGARCRIIIYKKELPDCEVSMMAPADIGGFRSPEFLSISPQEKVPALQCHESGMKISESDCISRYILSKYSHQGPSFQLDNAKSNMIARFHDMYLTTIQNCLYKPTPPFGPISDRKEALAEYSKQLYKIADLMEDIGPFMCGLEVSLADATVFPSIVFAAHMFPKFDSGIKQPIPPRIERWFQNLIASDPAFTKVHNEMMDAINAWDAKGRWDPIWLAGIRDDEPETIFDKIIAREIPATIVKEDDKILAFKDVNPAAPAHVLIIPKDRKGLTRLSQATNEHMEILGRLLIAAGEISNDESLGFGDGARIVINDGKDAGQSVFHLHVHVLGGRQLSWPPG